MYSDSRSYKALQDELYTLRRQVAELQWQHAAYQREREAHLQELAALRTERDQFRMTADFTCDWEYWRDPTGHFRYVSPACIRITGYYPDEFQADPHLLERLVHPDDREQVLRHMRDEQERRQPYELQFRIITRNGEEGWIGHACQPMYNKVLQWLGQRASNRDITRQKQVEKEFKESQARLQAIWETATDAMVLSDAEGIVLEANPAYFRLYGYTPEQVIGHSFTIIFPEEQRARALELYRRVFASHATHQSYEARAHHADGSERIVESFIDFVLQDDQRVALLSVIRDITRRKQGEEALHARQQFIQRIADTIPGLLYIYDLAEELNIYCNAQAYDILGYTADSIQGMERASLGAMLHPDDQEHYRHHLAALAQSHADTPQTIEMRVRRADGAWCWLHIREVVFARTQDGQPQQILGVAHDVTDRKEAEAQLHVFKTLVEHTPDGMGITSLDGTIIYANPAYCEMLGYDEDMAGLPLIDTYDEASDYLLGLVQLTAERGTWSGELTYKRKDGNTFPAHLKTFTIRDEQGTVQAVAGIIRDISERLQMEAALHESEERFRMAASLATDSIYEFDLMSGEAHIFNADTYQQEALQIPQQASDDWWQQTLHPDDRERVVQARARLIASDEPFHQEYRIVPGPQTILYLEDRAVVVRNTQDMAVRLLGVTTDITARKQAEAELRESQARLQAVFDNAAVGIFQLTPDGHWLDINQRGQQMLGYTLPELIQLTYLDIIHPAHRTQDLHYFQAMPWREQQSHRIERRWIRKDGSVFWGDLSLTAIFNAHGMVETILGVLVNITRSKEAEAALQQANQKLQQQTIRDMLTGLHNRRYLDETLPRELQRAARQRQTLGVIMLDIDHFKHYNDTYGHDAGDALLRAVGAFLLQSIRGDDIACRYGGEEFTLVLPGASLDDTRQRAEAIRAGVQALVVEHEGQTLEKITVSLGVTVFSDYRATADLLIRSADQALYQAKRSGRDRVVVARGP